MSGKGGSEAGYHFLQDYLNCQQLFYNRHVIGLDSRWTSPSLLYGNCIHEAMQEWYTALKEKDPVHQRVLRATAIFDSAMVRNQDSYYSSEIREADTAKGRMVISQYGLYYPFEDFAVLHTEQSLKHTLPSGYTLTGRVDMVVQRDSRKRTRLMDHKTTGWSIANLTRSLSVSGQVTCYLLLWNSNFPDLATHMTEFNILRYYQGSVDFKRHVIMKTTEDIENFAEQASQTFYEIEAKVTNPAAVYIKNGDHCFMFNRPCEYLQLCKGSNYKSLIGTEYQYKHGRS